jgi:hypothetical protein
VVALLMLAAVVAARPSAVPVGEGRPLFGWDWTGGSRTLLGKQFETPDQPGHWTDIFGSIVLLFPVILFGLAILLGVALSLRRRRRARNASPALGLEEVHYPDAPGGRLLRAARAAQAELARHEGGPPSDVVIVAWLRLEEAAADTGTARDPHQTPTEFTMAVRAGHETIGGALDELRGLYHRARFGPPDTVGPAEADAARAAIDRIIQALTPAVAR